MELTAAIEGLRAIRNKTVPTDVYLDSAYVLNGITSWIDGWRQKGWVNSKKQPVANKGAVARARRRAAQVCRHQLSQGQGMRITPATSGPTRLANRAMDELEAG